MASKASVLTTRRLFFAMDKVSKNALIDLVVDRARAELGEDAAEEAVAELVESWLHPVATVRGDRPISLRSAMACWDRKAAEYIERQKPHKCANCDAWITGGDLCINCSKPRAW